MRDLEETFKILRHYVMKLNPKKCTFGVRSEKFLGCMIDQIDTKATLNKIKVLLNMKSLTMVKEVQKLTRCIATLGRFIPRLVGNAFLSSKS